MAKSVIEFLDIAMLLFMKIYALLLIVLSLVDLRLSFSLEVLIFSYSLLFLSREIAPEIKL